MACCMVMPERTGPIQTPGSMTMDALDVTAPRAGRLEQPATQKAATASTVITPIPTSCIFIFYQLPQTVMMPNGQRERQGPAAADAGIAGDLNGWPLSAARCGVRLTWA